MARSTLLRFAFIVFFKHYFLLYMQCSRGKNKAEESKDINREPSKEWKRRRKWALEEVGQGEQEGWGDAWWRYLDINGSYAFYSKRNKAVEKALCLSGILVTSQHKLNTDYDIIRHLTQLPCIC